MKILVVTDLYPVKDDEKFTPKTIYDFVYGWKALGHEVKVIKPNFLFNSFLRGKPFYKNGIYGEVENINYWFPFWGNVTNKVKTDLSGFDIVIAHMPSGIMFANKLGVPFVAGVHISDLEVLTNPIYSIYFKKELIKGYRNAVKIGCRSEVIKNKFLRIFPEYKEKVFVAYSGVKEEPVKREWQKKDKYRVITCANLKKRKNIDKLIMALKGSANFELVIVGDGKELQKLKSISKGAENIIFKGYLPHKGTMAEMKKSDIFILPSQNETFGMVYLEAMASGCITVGLQGDGIDGIIKDRENGYLCSLGNIKETLDSILDSNNQNQVLENTYNTICNYTTQKACLNYLENSNSPNE